MPVLPCPPHFCRAVQRDSFPYRELTLGQHARRTLQHEVFFFGNLFWAQPGQSRGGISLKRGVPICGPHPVQCSAFQHPWMTRCCFCLCLEAGRFVEVCFKSCSVDSLVFFNMFQYGSQGGLQGEPSASAIWAISYGGQKIVQHVHRF